MIRSSKPELISLFNGVTQNITIDVAPKFNVISPSKRDKRKGVGNPNVWYLYIGYEPEIISGYELHEITLYQDGINVSQIRSKTKQERYNRIITTEYFSIFNNNDYILFDKQSQTIWVPAPGLSPDGISKIIQYIQSPFYYENQSYKEMINEIYKDNITRNITAYKTEKDALFQRLTTAKETLAKLTEEYVLACAKHDALIVLEDTALERFQQDLDYIKSFKVIKGIEFSNGKITVYMNENIAYNSKGRNPIIIPPVNIVVNLQKGSTPYYYSCPQEKYRGHADRMLFHPHAIEPNADNTIITCCWGNAGNDLTQAYATNEIFQLIELLIYFTQQYNENDSAGAKYVNWPKYEPSN